MKRLLVLFAVLAPLSLFIAGCGGTGTSSGKSGDLTEEQKQQMKAQMAKGKLNMQKGQAGGAPSEAAKK